MHTRVKRSVVLTITSVCTAIISQGATITDGFEGSSVSPIWTITGPGSPTLTTSPVFDGAQSLRLQAASSFPWEITLTHDFGVDQQGSISVHVDGDGLCCSASAGLQIIDGSQNWLAVIQQFAPGSFVGRIQPGGHQPETDSNSIGTTTGWHLLAMNIGPAGLSLSLDGNTVLTNSSVTAFRGVQLTVWGGPSAISNFDDFVATTTNAAPEPATAILFALGSLAAAVARSRRLRS